VEPKHFPEAPTVAVPIALERAGLKAEDIAVWEVNEAFSVVVRIVEKVLGVDPSKINVNGCARSLFVVYMSRSQNDVLLQRRRCTRPCYRQLRLPHHCLLSPCTQGWRVWRCWHLQWGLFQTSSLSSRTDIEIPGWRRFGTHHPKAIELKSRVFEPSSHRAMHL